MIDITLGINSYARILNDIQKSIFSEPQLILGTQVDESYLKVEMALFSAVVAPDLPNLDVSFLATNGFFSSLIAFPKSGRWNVSRLLVGDKRRCGRDFIEFERPDLTVFSNAADRVYFRRILNWHDSFASFRIVDVVSHKITSSPNSSLDSYPIELLDFYLPSGFYENEKLFFSF